MRDDIDVRPSAEADREWARRQLVEGWGSHMLVLHGELVDPTLCPGLVAGEREGLLFYRYLDGGACEIVTLAAFRTGRGIGTVLVGTLAIEARRQGCTRLVVTTTNDNLDALRFYQARGFRLSALRAGAVDAARRLQPEIAPTGNYGLPIRDEIELERDLA